MFEDFIHIALVLAVTFAAMFFGVMAYIAHKKDSLLEKLEDNYRYHSRRVMSSKIVE